MSVNNISGKRFMIIGLKRALSGTEKVISEFEETEALIKTYGGTVVAATMQNEARFDNATYIGAGKAIEVSARIKEKEIDIAVINDNIKPRQIFNLSRIFSESSPDIDVWDRTDLILNIFNKHAVTAESKLQIELARIRHMGPLLYGIGITMSQQGGGIGTRGMGETETEIMKRHWRNEISEIKKKLSKIQSSRERQMENRKKSGLPTISIVGYTNAGKTTLFNLLSGKNNYADDSLFATLDSSVSRIYLEKSGRQVFITDTIGFISNLPHHLVDSFKSTLMETVNSDLILHVIDASDPWMKDKIGTVEGIIKDLKADHAPRIFVFNKSDLLDKDRLETAINDYSAYNAVAVSALKNLNIGALLANISDILSVS